MPRKKTHSITTKEGLIDALARIANSEESKNPDKIRAMKQIGDMHGYNVDRTFRNVERMSPEDLEREMVEKVIQAVKIYLERIDQIELHGYSSKQAEQILFEHREASEKSRDASSNVAAMRRSSPA